MANNEAKDDKVKYEKKVLEQIIIDDDKKDKEIENKEVEDKGEINKINGDETNTPDLNEKVINERPPANVIVYIVAVILMGLLIFYMSSIYKNVENRPKKSTYQAPKEIEEKEELEEITIDSNVVKDLVYPIMRNSKYDINSYYNRESLTMADFSNNDILYNAFIHVYTGNLANYNEGYNSAYCSTPDKQKTFNAQYIELRINNLFSKTTNFQFTDFVVPSVNTDTVYVGTWKYDEVANRYIYYGDCNPIQESDIEYYDITVPVSAKGEKENETIYVDKYVGFAKVTNSTNSYQLYSDYNMTNLISDGTFKDGDRLNELTTKVTENKQKFKQYEYQFSKKDCSYEDYCFVQGKWK